MNSGIKHPKELKETIDGILSESKKVLENQDSSLAELKEAKDSLQKTFEQLGQEAMKHAGSTGAAGTSTEISTSWANETLDKFRVTAEAKDEPVDYGKAMVDFWSAQTKIATKKMELFSDVLKKAQMETVELMVSVGKDMTKDASEAVKKTTKDVTAASKKMATVK